MGGNIVSGGRRDGKQWDRLNTRLILGAGGRARALLRSEVKCDGWASSLYPGRGRAVVPAEWALWPPGRALVPPPSQPGPAQSPQEVPRSQVGEVGGAEESLMYLAGRGGQWLCAGRDLTQVRSVWFFVTFLRISGVPGGLCPSPTPLS